MEYTPIQFLQKLNECVKEFRKQQNDCGSEQDAAHFFNSNLKSFLKNHRTELVALGNMNFERPFMSFLKNYLLSEKING